MYPGGWRFCGGIQGPDRHTGAVCLSGPWIPPQNRHPPGYILEFSFIFLVFFTFPLHTHRARAVPGPKPPQIATHPGAF